MAKEIQIIPPDRFSPQPRVNISGSASANPVSFFVDRFRRRSVAERRELVRELTGLLDDLDKLNDAYVGYEKSLVSLRTLDQSLAAEERRILQTLDAQERQLVLQLRNDELRLMIEQLDLELKHEMAKRKLDQFANPPEKRTPVDPVEEAIKDAFNGGGRYKSKADAMRDDLIRRRGGEHNLTEEDHEHIRNAYRVAAEGDNSRGR